MIDKSLIDGLRARAKAGDQTVMRSPELRSLYDEIKIIPPEQRRKYGQQVNALRQELQSSLQSRADESETLPSIDVTAPWEANTKPEDRPGVLPATSGSVHPLTREMERIL